MRLRILTDQEAIQYPIAGGVCPVGGPVGGGPVAPPPSGEPHLIGTSAGLTGSLWVAGALLRFRSGDGNEYGETGTAQPTPSPTALPRAIRFTAEEVEYMDASGVARRISKTSLGAKPAGALTGAVRYDAAQPVNCRVTFAGATNHYQWSNGF